MSDKYLPLMRAAEYIGVSRVKLSQLAKDGVIPFTTSPEGHGGAATIFIMNTLKKVKRALITDNTTDALTPVEERIVDFGDRTHAHNHDAATA